ncbi:MAG: membrane protein insertion efficiency factor YidD [Phycisphaerales bacterium]|nr:membrane protein insertion efficiency factor YidD [Phycisphaerales bacterium]MCI0629933.1 membrane protein insertion efficiency factor YidD [Phycisphaerales bacterium]MCI0674901.1 membrane protein insertion efficiency factor YidD [Phycisphaerales bacterium]
MRLYQVTLGIFMGGQCRFFPTCSEYAVTALQIHGAWRGSWLAARRILRCHPCGGHGFDPVPPTDRT